MQAIQGFDSIPAGVETQSTQNIRDLPETLCFYHVESGF